MWEFFFFILFYQLCLIISRRRKIQEFWGSESNSPHWEGKANELRADWKRFFCFCFLGEHLLERFWGFGKASFWVILEGQKKEKENSKRRREQLERERERENGKTSGSCFQNRIRVFGDLWRMIVGKEEKK